MEGHTDADPIKRSKKNYKDNWDLAASRANSVLNYLIQYGKLNPDTRTLYSAAFANYKPVAKNDSKANKAKNRRVEVVVVMGRRPITYG